MDGDWGGCSFPEMVSHPLRMLETLRKNNTEVILKINAIYEINISTVAVENGSIDRVTERAVKFMETKSKYINDMMIRQLVNDIVGIYMATGFDIFLGFGVHKSGSV